MSDPQEADPHQEPPPPPDPDDPRQPVPFTPIEEDAPTDPETGEPRIDEPDPEER